jgi:hypothetical protein
LKAEYRLLAIFVLVASIVLAGITFLPGVKTHLLIIVAFIFGAVFSALAGNMGMKIATKTNVRTTQAARTSLPQALKVSFTGGTVMGLGVAGLAVLGLGGLFIVFLKMFNVVSVKQSSRGVFGPYDIRIPGLLRSVPFASVVLVASSPRTSPPLRLSVRHSPPAADGPGSQAVHPKFDQMFQP